ncbi:hypothetical protein PG984_009610 [Apiospora sp. TS-2023a]
MRIYVLLYWFLAASKFNLSGCDQQLLGTEDARDGAGVGAGSICYTYITTILVTITADSSDTRGDTTNQLHSTAASYPLDSLAQQKPTRTRVQAGDGLSSPGTLGSQENGMSNNPGHSAISTPDPTSGARMSDGSDADPSGAQISSATPLTNPSGTSRDDLASTTDNTKTSPYMGSTPTDESPGRDPTAPTSSAGAILTTPGQTSGIYSGGASNTGQDNTELLASSTPGPPGGSDDVSSSFFPTTPENTDPTVLNPSMANPTSETNPAGVIVSTPKEGPATTSIGIGFPTSTNMPGSDTPSGGPTNPLPTSQATTQSTSNQPASLTTQGPSSVTASQVILSIEAIASFGPASQKPQARLRREPTKRDDTDPGFVGDSQDPNPDSCSNAVRFRQSGGQLQRRGRAVSVDPGVDYIDLANYAGGSISTLFSVVDDTLQWNNDAFYEGRARFCQVDSETVYAVFTNAGGPEGCSPVALVVYRGTVALAIS